MSEQKQTPEPRRVERRTFEAAVNERRIIDRLDECRRQLDECRRQREQIEALIGHIVSTIPVNKVLAASKSGADLVEYFRRLHSRGDQLTHLLKLSFALSYDFATADLKAAVAKAIAEAEGQPT